MTWMQRFYGPVAPAVPVYRDVWPVLPPVFPPRQRPMRQRAAVTFVAGATTTGSGTSATVAAPAGVQAGDFLIMHIATAGVISTPAATGWTWTYAGPGASPRTKVMWRVGSGSEPASYALTWGTSVTCAITVSAFRGADTAGNGWHAVLGHNGVLASQGTPHSTTPVYFQQSDYMAVQMVSRSQTSSTKPAGYTDGPIANQAVGNAIRSHVAYLSVSNTQNLAATTWTSAGGNAITDTYTIALRPSGSDALGLKNLGTLAFSTNTSTSLALGTVVTYSTGDLLVVVQGAWVGTTGAAITLGTPSGWAVWGNARSYALTNNRLTTQILYRVSDGTGADSPTITASIASNPLAGMILVFGSGSGGGASLPGTPGDTVDTTSGDTVITTAAFTVSGFSDPLFELEVGWWDANSAPGTPSGFTSVATRGFGNPVGMNLTFRWNGAASPAGVDFSGATGRNGTTHHFGVGVNVSVGLGATVGQSIWLG